MRIAIVGSGYVGLVSGACFADAGHIVTCVDKDAKRIEGLDRGIMPIFEPGLAEIVISNAAAGRLSFSMDIQAAVALAEVIFIAVGTPSRRGDGHADLSFVYAAAEQIADGINGFKVIVNKSTVPVGTGDEVERIIRARRPDADFAVASNPEFLREGAAIDDFKRPDRIIVGSENDRARRILAELYEPLRLDADQIILTSRRTAELIKYAGNAFLAMKITFINEVADLCECVGANVKDVARGMGRDRRIGEKFLEAGPGFGGSCFPKDTLALLRTSELYSSPLHLVETTIQVNESRKLAMAEKILAALGDRASESRVGVLGLTFKASTDDVRDSPSLTIIPALQAMGVTVQVFDPQGMEEAKKILKDVVFAASEYEAAANVDALVVLTEWDQFRGLDFGRLKSAMSGKIVLDFRNIYSLTRMTSFGFSYTGLGQPRSIDHAEVTVKNHMKGELYVTG